MAKKTAPKAAPTAQTTPAAAAAAQSPGGSARAESWPRSARLINQTANQMVFPELGAQAAANLAPFTQAPVVFANAVQQSILMQNLQTLAETHAWDEQCGVFIDEQK